VSAHPRHRGLRALGPLLFLTLVSVLLVSFGVVALPWQAMSPDFICYWSAGEILASSRSPYDVELQTGVQRAHGWDRETSGLGVYDFLPYYYPPWFGLLWVLVLPLGYQTAKLLWLFLNVELALLSGHLLRPAVPAAPGWVPVLLAALSLFTLACVLLGQTALVVLFLAALSWRLLEAGRDRSAGVALAWLTIKPQLTAVLLLAVLLRLLRLRRWQAVASFVITLAVLGLISTLVVPSWPLDMLRAPGRTPAPTEDYPWIGNAWLLVLRALGLPGWLAWALYLAVALPFLGAAVRAALRGACPWLDLMALALLAAFFVAPYARHYDFPVLLIPLLALLRGRPHPLAARLLPLALVILPYVQLFLLVHYKPLYNPSGRFLLEGSFFWVPLVLTAAWLVSARGREPQESVA
jgi:Glycosyltransferase family 87